MTILTLSLRRHDCMYTLNHCWSGWARSTNLSYSRQRFNVGYLIHAQIALTTPSFALPRATAPVSYENRSTLAANQTASPTRQRLRFDLRLLALYKYLIDIDTDIVPVRAGCGFKSLKRVLRIQLRDNRNKTVQLYNKQVPTHRRNASPGPSHRVDSVSRGPRDPERPSDCNVYFLLRNHKQNGGISVVGLNMSTCPRAPSCSATPLQRGHMGHVPILQTICCLHMCSFKLKMYQNRFRPKRSAPDPAGGAYDAPTDPVITGKGTPLRIPSPFNAFNFWKGGLVNQTGSGPPGVLRRLCASHAILATACLFLDQHNVSSFTQAEAGT